MTDLRSDELKTYRSKPRKQWIICHWCFCGFTFTSVRNGKDHKLDDVMTSGLVTDTNEGWA